MIEQDHYPGGSDEACLRLYERKREASLGRRTWKRKFMPLEDVRGAGSGVEGGEARHCQRGGG